MRFPSGLFRRKKPAGPRPEIEWRETTLPPASLRGPDGDGLIIRPKQMTVWSRDYSGGHFAHGDVITVVGGERKVHENVLMWTQEARDLERFLSRSLLRAKGDATLTIFDDGMTLRIERVGADEWHVDCRPVPMPGPGETWERFPVFGFRLTRGTIEATISELSALSSLLTPNQPRPLP